MVAKEKKKILTDSRIRKFKYFQDFCLPHLTFLLPKPFRFRAAAQMFG